VTEMLLGLIILLLLGVLVFLIVLSKRRGAAGPEIENQLRARLEAEQAARVAAETRLEAERASFEEQRRLLDEAESRLKDAFSALSADALKTSRTEFLSQADEKLKPIRDLLGAYETHLREIEKIRSDAYGGLKNHLDTLARAHDLLQREAHQLSTALRSPTVRGAWGQMALRNAAELAGMSPYCDFTEQVSVATEDAQLRPDMTVRLPNHRTIVVDAKAPLDAYREAVSAGDEAGRKVALSRHAQAVRGHMRALGQKSYWSQFKEAPDFVVLFLPGESFFSAALEQDQTLIEEGMKSGVVLASPTTLIALLRAVAYGWRQEAVAESAQKIAETGKQLYDRIRVFAEYLKGVGTGLKVATDNYNAAVGSYQSRLEPGARHLTELGVSTGKDLPELPQVEGPTRAIAPPEPEAPGDEALPV